MILSFSSPCLPWVISHRTKLKSQASKKPFKRDGQKADESRSRTSDGFWNPVTNAQSSSSSSPLSRKTSQAHLGTTISGAHTHQEPISGSGNNRKGTWTDVEDEHLEKGYKKYGFSWTRIAKDPELDLAHRTGPQVRDRFRTKFPGLYGEDPRQHPRHGKEQKEKDMMERLNRRGSQSKEALIGDRPSILARLGGSADPMEKSGLQHGLGRDNGNRSDPNEITVDPISTISPNRPSASVSSAFNILGLLNSDGEDDRPSSDLPLDTWDTNVTLPPLLWEEMATRPMFDLE